MSWLCVIVKKIILSIILSLIFICSASCEVIKDVRVVGEYYYGPNISDNQACEYAKENAKNNALRKVIEESVITSTRENCSDVNNKKECSFFEDTWSFLGEGFLKGSNFTNRIVDKDDLGKFCRINLITDVIKPSTQSDPSYNLNAFLKPSKVFRDGSSDFKIEGEVSQNSYIHILGWYPQEDKNNYHCLTDYFNEYKSLTKKIYFPPSGRQVKLKLPPNTNLDVVSQYLILVALKENISLPCFQQDKSIKIKKEKLFNFLSRIDRDKWTKEMLIFKIIK